jgi:hypothetical protein
MKRPYPANDDWIGKGRTAACVAVRRHFLEPVGDDWDDLINQAAMVYWQNHALKGESPRTSWVRAYQRTRNYYRRKIRGVRWEVERDVNPRFVSLDEPVYPGDRREPQGARTWADLLAADPPQRQEDPLAFLDDDDLRQALIRGRRAAGVDEWRIDQALQRGTIGREMATIRMAAAGHTNDHIALALDTTEGTVRQLRQSIRRWLKALASELQVTYEAWDTSGGNQKRAAEIQAAYPDGRKPAE